MATAMILVQANEVSVPKVAQAKKLYEKIISTKHEEPLAKFGAVLGQGILDAGGRNVTICLQSRNGSPNISSIVGMAVFLQSWYWFPLAHFLNLTFTPTAVIALNKDLKIPKLTFISNARPSLFAYPPPTKPPTQKEVEKVATAVLSTTAKAKARAKKSEKEKEKGQAGEGMDIDKPSSPTSATAKSDEKAEGETDKMAVDEAIPSKAEPEPTSEELQNMARVIPAQVKYISWKQSSRYQPVKKGRVSGIIMISDSKPGEAEEIIPFSTPSAPSTSTQEAEPSPPEPFEYPFDD